jgi:hypothetical protein
VPLPPKTLDAPNGDKFTIYPFGPDKLTAVLRELKDKGIEIVPGKLTLREGLEFQQTIARTVLHDWQRNDGGVLNPTVKKEREDLIATRAKVVGWIVTQAEALAAGEDKEFEADSGN